MSANSGSGGVRNLRAMFENRGDQSTSPPSRGRSPSDSADSGNSRPVSKVRASFVAVERPGDIKAEQQWGLRKASDVSSMAEVRENEANDVTRTSTAITDTEPTKSPTSPHTSKHTIDGGLGSILRGSSFEDTPKKQTQEEKPVPVAASPSDRKQPTTNGVGSRAFDMIEKMKNNKHPGPPPSTTLVTKSDAKPLKNPHPKPMVKPSPASPRSPRLDKSSPKTPTSPTMAKSMIRGGPAKIKGVMESAKRASEAREAVKKESPKPIQRKEAEKPVVKKEVEKPVPRKEAEKAVPKKESQTKPKINGVKREAVSAPAKPTVVPRSPTKPVKLPTAATATTTAATARRDAQPQAQQPVRKPAPRASLPAAQSRATAPTTTSLHKKTSRASLATNGKDRPTSRVSLHKPDDSFLARMTRPTQSSALKTHDKVESPPRSRTTASKQLVPKPKGSRKSDQSDSQHSKLDDVAEAPTDNSVKADASADNASAAAISVPMTTPPKVNGTVES